MGGLLAAQVVALVAGGVLLLALGWWRLPAGLLVPTAWMVGTGTLAAERLLLAQAGLGWNAVTLSLPWVPIAFVAGRKVKGFSLSLLFSRVREWRKRVAGAQSERMALIIEVAVVFVIVLWTAGLIRDTLAQPLTGWDAQIIWIFKGRVLYDTGTVAPAFFTNAHYAVFAHLDYPIIVPLTVERIYEWTGDQEVLVKAWWPLLAGAAAAGLYFGLSGLVGRVARLAGVAALLGLPAIETYAGGVLAGYAELPLAVFFMYGALFVYRWICVQRAGSTEGENRERNAQEFGLAAFFFGMTGFTKNEGLVVALAGLGLLVVMALLLRRVSFGQALVGLTLGALVFLPWQIEKAVLGIRGDLQPTVGGIIANWNARIEPITTNLAFYASNTNTLGIAWLLLPVLSLACLLLVARKWLATLPLLLLVLAHIAGTFAAYLTTPFDLTWHLGTSGDRLVFQPVLVVILLSTIYLGQLLDMEAPFRIKWLARPRGRVRQEAQYSGQ